MDTVKIGKFLAELRRGRSLTQEQLGERLGTSNKTVSRWENGNYMPPVEMLMELSKFYDVSINEILSGKRLDETEEKSAAEENLKAVLEESPFSIEERKSYFTKKWKRDHRFELIIHMLILTALLVGAVLLKETVVVLAAAIVNIGFCVVRYNRMMAYVEKNAFDGKGNIDDKNS